MDVVMESLAENWSSIFEDDNIEDEQPLDDLHLNNAINLDYIKAHLGIDPGYNIEVPNYIRHELDMIRHNMVRKDTEIHLGFQDTIVCFANMYDKRTDIEFPSAKLILHTIQNASAKYSLNLPIEQLEKSSLENVSIPEYWWQNFNGILNLVNARSELRRDSTKLHLVPQIKCHGLYCTAKLLSRDEEWTLGSYCHVSFLYKVTEPNIIRIGTFDSVLLLLDTIGQRICLIIANQIARQANTPGFIGDDGLRVIIDEGDRLLDSIKNHAYEVIAMFEAMCVGVLLSMHEDGVNPRTMFLDNCINESEGLLADDGMKQKCMSTIETWCRTLRDMDSAQISNIFCIYRIWGHPTVDIKEGMKKVNKLGTASKFIPESIQGKSLLQFRKMFLMSFYAKHKVYPDVDLSEENYLSRCISSNSMIDVRDPEYSIDNFTSVGLKKIWDVPETYDIFHILNDKAVSPTLSELHKNIRSGRGTQCGALRRGLWRWMTGDSIRCREFLSGVDQNGIDPDSLIIGLYEKEREIKITARMFALMSEEMRYYFVLTEELIANHILPYFPEITMKDSLNVLMRKLWSNSKRTSENKLDVNINIDFSKWNLNMRNELVLPIFREIDKLFGYQNLIGRTHDIFTNSYIYSASGKYTPPVTKEGFIQDPPMAYTGHIGGFEGLRQKGWTIVTVVLLASAAEDIGVKINLMGQGDNQVVRLNMPIQKWLTYKMNESERRKEAARTCEKYVKHISEIFHDAQLPIKVRETWRSCRLFMYGKMMTLDNNTMPQWYKKVLRSYAMSNEGVLTFGGVIGTIATNMSSAASTSTMPDIMYIIYLIFAEWSINCLLNYHPFTRSSYITKAPGSVSLPGQRGGKRISLPPMIFPTVVASLILIPTSVGGNITIPLTSFICRGFPDPGSEGYAWIKFLMAGQTSLYPMLYNWYSFLQNPTIELDQLIQSPMSINHWKPPTPGIQSRDTVREWLMSGEFKKNRFIKNVTAIMRPFERKEICTELATDPMSPIVTNELYNIMPQVAIDGVLRRIENTRTIRKMAMSANTTIPVISKLMEAEENFLSYIWWRCLTKGAIFSGCATAQARLARNHGWGRKIIQVTTPHPLELLLGDRCERMSLECMARDHIYVRKGTEGKFAPYLGSKTKTKVHTQQDESARREPLISTGAKLARYMSWLNLGPNIKDFIERNVRVICNIDVFDNFFAEDMAGETFTGSVEHRFHPSSTSDGSFINYAPQIGSTVFMSSDYLPTYGRGKTNYTLAFQPLYCFIQYVAACHNDASCLHFHLNCEQCIVPTEDQVPDIRGVNKYIERALNECNHDIIRETLGQIEKKPNITMLSHPTLVGKRVEISNISKRTIRHSIYKILGHTLATKLRTHQESTGTNVGLEDLQSYPRIYSYKLCVDTLSEYTVRAMIFQYLLKKGSSSGVEHVNNAKRKLSVHLNKLPPSAYKELGSLCMGRNYSARSDSEQQIIRQFPESIGAYLEGIRDLIVRTLDRVGKLYDTGEYTVLPAPQMTKRTHLYVLTEICTLNGCVAHMDPKRFEDSISEDTYPDCKERCLQRALKTVHLTAASLDRMFKELVTIRPRIQIVVGKIDIPNVRHSAQSSTRESGTVPDHLVNRQKKLKRPTLPICIPTTSLYKWETITDTLDRPHIIVLGDGTGGTSLVLSSHCQDATIYPCALLEDKGCIPQDMESIKPSLSRGLKNVCHNIHLAVPDNIMDDRWEEKMRHEIQLIGPMNVIIVSDVEDHKGNRGLQERVIRMAPEGTKLILKLYAHEYYTGLGRGLGDPTLVFSPVYNNRYGEFIIVGHKSTGNLLVRDKSIKNAWNNACVWMETQQTDMKTINKQMKQKYENIWRYNINFALRQMSKSGPSFTSDVLRLKTYEVVSMLHSYIKNTYHFGKNARAEGSKRMTPRAKDECTRCIQMSLLIWTDAEISDTNRIQIHPRGMEMTPTLVYSVEQSLLSSIDLQVVNILREYKEDIGNHMESIGNIEATLNECIRYGEGHRTYTWTLTSLAGGNKEVSRYSASDI